MKSILIFTFFIYIAQQTNAQVCFPPSDGPDALMEEVMEFENKIREAFAQDQYNLCLASYNSLTEIYGDYVIHDSQY
ncbi:MAG: hypothetical protein U5K79_25070 [Cyclobacteriaceae bacterium]|nr:hypothetical protein [Cyclobacteriaceae bacterium]